MRSRRASQVSDRPKSGVPDPLVGSADPSGRSQPAAVLPGSEGQHAGSGLRGLGLGVDALVITTTAKAAGFSGCLRNPKGQSSPQSDSRGRVRVRVLEITARQDTAEHPYRCLLYTSDAADE